MLKILIPCLIVIAALAVPLWRMRLAQRRETHIRTFAFPKGIFSKVIARHPHLTQRDMELVSRGLRQFFLAHLKSGKQYVSMPSAVADDLWHELILYTRTYQDLCNRAFGTFLHHTPAVLLSGDRTANSGLRRCWKFCCVEENINPLKPSRLPLLFGLDAKLAIVNGFHYLPDCKRDENRHMNSDGAIVCGGDFSDGSFPGGTEGMDSSGDGHDWFGGGDGDGGGGGDGCSGGGD